MKIFMSMVAVVSLVGGCGPTSSQADYEQRIERIATIASEYAGFNGTILVADSDGVFYHNSFGFADEDGTIALTPEHRFSPGSIDKEFTTVALMLLEQQGRLNYHDKLSGYLPELPHWANIVTIEQILTHTSGIPDINYGRNLTTADAIEQIMAVDELVFEPGQGFLYGNLNSVLRAMIIEQITGEPQDVFIQENIFDAAGMDSAYSRTDLAIEQPMTAFGDLPMAVAGIDMYVTALDLYRWETALWNGDIVARESLENVIVPHELRGSSSSAYFDFGSFQRNEDGALVGVMHDGTHPSHYALQSINFDTGLIIILLSSDGAKSTLGPLRQSIASLADNQTVALPASWWLANEVKQQGIASALENYRAAVEEGNGTTADGSEIDSNEQTLNGYGYSLSGSGQMDDAIAVLGLNVELFPNSANAHDSFADILIQAEDYAQAKTITEQGLRLARQDRNSFLIQSMEDYLSTIQANE